MNVTVIGFERLEETDNDFTVRSNCNRLPLLVRHVANSWGSNVKETLLIPENMLSIYLLPAIGLTPGGSSTVHIYTKTIQRTMQLTKLDGKHSGIRTQSGQTKINDELIVLYAYLF